MKDDSLIEELIKKAENKANEIGSIQNYSAATNLVFPLGEGSSLANSLNLNTVREPKRFVEVLAFLLEKFSHFDAAAKELGVKANFLWGGFSKDAWVRDIKNKVSVIKLSEKKKELSSIRKQLDELMSPEMKRDIQLQAIRDALENYEN